MQLVRRRICESAGTGRQARLRGVCQPTWEFKSPLSHQKYQTAFWLSGIFIVLEVDFNQNRKRLRRFRQPVQTLADTAIFRKAKNANKYSSRARINPYSRISLSDSFLSFCASRRLAAILPQSSPSSGRARPSRTQPRPKNSMKLAEASRGICRIVLPVSRATYSVTTGRAQSAVSFSAAP